MLLVICSHHTFCTNNLFPQSLLTVLKFACFYFTSQKYIFITLYSNSFASSTLLFLCKFPRTICYLTKRKESSSHCTFPLSKSSAQNSMLKEMKSQTVFLYWKSPSADFSSPKENHRMFGLEGTFKII